MKLRYSKRALQQIDKSLGYVAERSPAGAAKVEQCMTTLLALFKQHSLTGIKTRIPGVRRMFLTPHPYLIDYFVADDEIVVQRFRHTARRPVA